MRIGIIGFGREGQSALKYLKKHPEYRDAEFVILDSREELELPSGVGKELGSSYLKNLTDFDLLVRSPGVYAEKTELRNARKKGVRVTTGSNLFFEAIRDSGVRVIGVTGTKGKGTVSTLIYNILKRAKKKVLLAGNIGKPVLDTVNLAVKSEFVVIEMSSFQLQDIERSPDIGVLLNITPDHMEVHKSFKEYVKAKSNLFNLQKSEDKIYCFLDSHKLVKKAKSEVVVVSSDGFDLFNREELKVIGRHNYLNCVMATIVARDLGVSDGDIRKAVLSFKGLAYRTQLSRRLKVRLPSIPGNFFINFYNDSAGTNPETASAAVLSFNSPIILIAGGKDKNLNYTGLAKAISASETRAVILYGENKEKINSSLSTLPKNISVHLVDDLESAVTYARILAQSLITKYLQSVVVLFSPASASFDMFLDYADRGNKFDEVVKNLKD